jgi:pimeloyl-ACP methyl ester carboxylesterase
MYDCAHPHRHLHSNAMNEIAFWVDWLKAKGAGPIAVAGHSRGGNQTAWYAAEAIDPAVEKVVLIAPATWTAERSASGFERQFGAPLEPLFDKAQALVAAGKGDTMMDVPGFVYCRNAKVAAATFVDYYKNEPRRDSVGLLAKIKRPVLVVGATEDTAVPDLVGRMRMVELAHVRYVEVDGAGHFFRDLYGEDVADAIDEFLDADG